MNTCDNTSYKKYIKFKISIIFTLLVLVVALMVVAISIGSSGLTVKETIKTLVGQGTKQSNIIVWNIRMPRIVTAVLSGVGLAATGCVIQSLLRNPLASASTLGISQGASFGASIAIIYFGAELQNQVANGGSITSTYLISFCAFIFSLLSTFLILGLSRLRKISPEAMVLAGVAISSLFSGGTTLLQYFADDVEVAAVVFWTFGDLGRCSWTEVFVMLIVVTLATMYFYANHWNYNALVCGEESAKGLGVNVESSRIVGMVVCSLTAATIVSFVGVINFVGLISPHLVRRIIGNDYRFLLPASAFTGALIMLLGDIVARTVVSPVILPIGALTSFLGAPLFIYLLFKRGTNR